MVDAVRVLRFRWAPRARRARAALQRRITPLSAVTALIYLLDAVALACGATLRTPGTNAPAALGALAVAGFALAVYALARGHRFTQGEATAMLVVQLAGIASMTRSTHLDLAALGDGLSLSMLGAYASWLLGRPAAAVFYAGLSLWVAAIVGRDNGYLTAAALLLAGQAMVTTEIVRVLRRRVQRLTDCDPLTGVLNRRGLADAVRALSAPSRQQDAMICLALVDLDDLRLVNNTGGHLAGDALLVAAADEWRDVFRQMPVTIGRIGGDEFVLVFAGLSEAVVRDSLDRAAAASAVRWTSGLATLRPGETFRDGLARADAEMYANKADKADKADKAARSRLADLA